MSDNSNNELPFPNEKDFFQELENQIEKLPTEQQSQLFKPCGMRCAQNFVLKIQKQQFEECHCDLDLQYQKYGNTEYFFAEIIEPHHIYEIGYPRCFCPLVSSGFATKPIHCECSRQSIIFVLQQLMPNKNIHVETIHTILTGGPHCRFRVMVD